MSALYFSVTFLVIGLLAYYADAVKGVGWYRGWYKLTHKEPLPLAQSRGFIVGRKAGDRIWTAAAMALIASGLLLLVGERDLITLFWKTIAEVAALFFGFFVAGFIHQKYNPEAKTARMLDTLDGIESGAIDPTATAREAVAKRASDVRAAAQDLYRDLTATRSPEVGETTATPTDPPTATTEGAPKKSAPDLEGALRRFQGR